MKLAFDIADAVVSELNAAPVGTFNESFTAVRRTIPLYNIAELKNLTVAVVPKKVEIAVATRAASSYEFAIDIAKVWMRLKGIFDDSFDVDFAINYIEQDSRQKLNQIESDYRKQVEQVNRQNAQQQTSLAADRDTTLTALAEDNQARIAENQAELDAAKAELQVAIKAAADANKPKPDTADETYDPESVLNRLQESLNVIGGNLTAAVGKISAIGTFNAAGVRGLAAGSDDWSRRTAMATEQTSRNTERLIDKMGRLQGTFG